MVQGRKKKFYTIAPKNFRQRKMENVILQKTILSCRILQWFIPLHHRKINALSNWLRLFSFVSYWSPPTTSLPSCMMLLEVKPMKPSPIYFFLLYAVVSSSITSEQPATHLQLVAQWQTPARRKLLGVFQIFPFGAQ